MLQRRLVDAIRASPFVGISIDETTDVSTQSTLVCFVRYLDKSHKPQTRFLELIKMTGSTSAEIFAALESCLRKHGVVSGDDWSKCASFSSDGCSAMRGVRKGVATLVQQRNPKCVCCHCAAHRLQLVSEDAFEKVTTFHAVADDVFTRIYGHFCRSSQRTHEFNVFQKEFNDDDTASSVRYFCKTRWLSRGHVVQQTMAQLPALLSMFKQNLDSRPAALAATAAAAAMSAAASIPVPAPVIAAAVAPVAAPAFVHADSVPVPADGPAASPKKQQQRKRSRVNQLQDKLSAAFAPTSEKRRRVPSSRAREGAEQEQRLEPESHVSIQAPSCSSLSAPSSSSSSSFSSFSSSSPSSSCSPLSSSSASPFVNVHKPPKLDPLQSLFDDIRSIEFLSLLFVGADVLPSINALSSEFQKRDLFAYDVFSRVDDCIAQLEEAPLTASSRLFRRVEDAMDKKRTAFVDGTKVAIDVDEDRLQSAKVDVDCLPGALTMALRERFPSQELLSASKIFAPTSHPTNNISMFGWEELEIICRHYDGIVDPDEMRREYPVIRLRLSRECKGMTVFDAWHQLLSDDSFVARYPNMCKIAALFLIVMPTSVDCERAFSVMAMIKTKMRNQLEITSTDALMRIAMNGPTFSDTLDVNALVRDAHRSFRMAKQRRT